MDVSCSASFYRSAADRSVDIVARGSRTVDPSRALDLEIAK